MVAGERVVGLREAVVVHGFLVCALVRILHSTISKHDVQTPLELLVPLSSTAFTGMYVCMYV